MRNKTLLSIAVAAMLMVQVSCVSLHWRNIQSRNVDFAALLGTARLIHDGGMPDYKPTHLGVDRDAPEQPAARPANAPMSDSLHPPFEAFLFLPLTPFSYTTAFILWTILNLVLLWMVPAVLWTFLPRLHSMAHILAMVYGTFFPVLVCLMFGQDSIVLLFLLSFSVSFLLKGKQFPGGFFLALGLFKFQVVLPVFAVLIAMRYWRAIAGFACGTLALLLGMMATIGPKAVFAYIRFVFAVGEHISTHASTRTVLMPNLRGLVSLVPASLDHPGTAALFVLTLSMALLVASFVWIKSFSATPIAVQFSLAVVVASLISYHYYIYNATILVIPMLLLANELAASDANTRTRMTFIVSSVVACGGLLCAAFAIIPLYVGMAALTIGSMGFAGAAFALPLARQRSSNGI